MKVVYSLSPTFFETPWAVTTQRGSVVARFNLCADAEKFAADQVDPDAGCDPREEPWIDDPFVF